jgi:hypothetical protein
MVSVDFFTVHFPGTAHRVSCCETVTASSVLASPSRWRNLVLRRYCTYPYASTVSAKSEGSGANACSPAVEARC